jgi:hypothetical protein
MAVLVVLAVIKRQGGVLVVVPGTGYHVVHPCTSGSDAQSVNNFYDIEVIQLLAIKVLFHRIVHHSVTLR